MIDTQMLKGLIDGIILHIIKNKETYGYEIITELNNSASVLGYAKEGTIYPILYRLQEAELIQCRLAPAAANGGFRLSEPSAKTGGSYEKICFNNRYFTYAFFGCLFQSRYAVRCG